MSRYGKKQVLSAKTATYNEDKGIWTFNNGSIITISGIAKPSTTTARFETYSYPFGPGPMQMAELPKDANSMMP